MARNTLKDLRDHLFETIERLKDEDEPMDIDRADAVVRAAQAITATAKVEVSALKAAGLTPGPGGFLQLPEDAAEDLSSEQRQKLKMLRGECR